MDTVRQSWRFVDASELNDDIVNFGDLHVRSGTRGDEEIGRLEGFIVDPVSGRLHFVVVESGGSFDGGSHLLPPKYTQLDAEQGVMWIDATRDAVRRFPSFDADQYGDDISEQELWAIERSIIEAYGDDPGVVAPVANWERSGWSHYTQPTWWHKDYLGVRTLERSESDADVRLAPGGTVDADTARAQPGDVLGIARGGETTNLGDTAEDEDERHREAEREGTPLTEDALSHAEALPRQGASARG